MSLEQDFPLLKSGAYQITSPVDIRYNCVAWALGDKTRWWEPSSGGFWPTELEDEPDLSQFTHALGALGFKPCEDSGIQPGVEGSILGRVIQLYSRQAPSLS